MQNHHGDRNVRSTLDFLVKFRGYDEVHNLWLPYHELSDNRHLHAYLIRKPYEVTDTTKVSRERPGIAQAFLQKAGGFNAEHIRSCFFLNKGVLRWCVTKVYIFSFTQICSETSKKWGECVRMTINNRKANILIA